MARTAPNRTEEMASVQRRPRVSLFDLKPDRGDFLRDVVAGLARARKELSPKYFYDERGSALFEAICELPEYYPTRTEMAMMQAHAGEMARCLGPECLLIEFGSGSGRKTRVLIAALEPVAYMPIDIAGGQLETASRALGEEFPELNVIAVCADYSRPLALPETGHLRVHRRAIFFPGSTIGNFTPPEALEFLQRARVLAGQGGAMLVGVDLEKDPAVLHAAYNDSRGITAQFNLNLLARINRELGGDFDLASFRHHAVYSEALGRIEMHLVSLQAQEVTVAGHRFTFQAGETIHTENSCKYSVAGFQALARSAGFAPQQCWVDPERLFSIHYLVAV
jgi:dimethylhistidine N-methyltransferase